jgi:dTDP-4-dehydrorhamnose reductase
VRALVVGGSGQVGAALARALTVRGHSVVATHHRVPQPGTRPLDLLDAAAVSALIGEVAPDVVFCPAGLTHVDACEDHPEEARRANAEAPAAAARAAAARGARFVFFSTEYVFDGAAGPYAEDAPVRPLSVYGRSKLQGEHAVLSADPRALVVRTAAVYGPEPQGKNFVYQVLRRAAVGEAVRVPSDQRSTPTYNEDLAEAVVALVERGVGGVVHVAGPTVLDRHAFARLVCEVFGLPAGCLVPVPTAELGQRAPRPLRAGLRIDRCRGLLGVEPRDPAAGLIAMREALGCGVDTSGGGR